MREHDFPRSPENGTASWRHVEPYNVRSAPEYPAFQGGESVIIGYRRLVNNSPLVNEYEAQRTNMQFSESAAMTGRHEDL